MAHDEKTYLDAFNDGYRLALYNPELYEKLKGSLNKSDELDAALMDGAEEAELERERQRMKQLQSLQNEQQTEKDKDGVER